MPSPLTSGSKAASLIIQKGLACGILNYDVNGNPIPPGTDTFLSFGAGITPFFSLYIEAPPAQYVAAAGSRVYKSSQDIFKEVDEHGKQIGPPLPAPFGEVDPATGKRYDHQEGAEAWMVVPRDREAQFFGEATRDITVKFVFLGAEHEKTYKVRERNAGRLIEVINFTNATKKKVSAAISGLKRITTQAIVEIRNFRLTRKRNKY